MDLAKQPAITLTLHQLQRLVEGYVDLNDCKDLNTVAGRIFEQAALHAETGCDECAETMRALSSYTLLVPGKPSVS